MKIGIIVYSQTGHTLSIAQKLYEGLIKNNHEVILEQITTQPTVKPNGSKPLLDFQPKVNEYDMIYFGAPVEVFSLCSVMKTYLAKIDDLSGKKIKLFTTEHFPFPWMGGRQAIGKMKGLCIEKKGDVEGTLIINWTNKKREEQIENGVLSILVE